MFGERSLSLHKNKNLLGSEKNKFFQIILFMETRLFFCLVVAIFYVTYCSYYIRL